MEAHQIHKEKGRTFGLLFSFSSKWVSEPSQKDSTLRAGYEQTISLNLTVLQPDRVARGGQPLLHSSCTAWAANLLSTCYLPSVFKMPRTRGADSLKREVGLK